MMGIPGGKKNMYTKNSLDEIPPSIFGKKLPLYNNNSWGVRLTFVASYEANKFEAI
jgi:hypothetical protein